MYWASPEDQARHECFVLAPEYGSVVIDDNYKPSALFDATVNLVRALTTQYRVDTSRLYVTGQSMGAMMALGMNIKHPGLFAASFIVAGQWPSSQAKPLATLRGALRNSTSSQDHPPSIAGGHLSRSSLIAARLARAVRGWG